MAIKDSFYVRLFKRLGLGLLIVVTIIGVTIFLGADISKGSDYIYSTRNALAMRQKSQGQLAQLKIRAEEAKPYISRLEAALPPKDQLLRVSEEIVIIARRYDLGSGDPKFASGEVVVSGSLKKIGFQLNAQGTYQNIFNFIKEIEFIPYFINLTDVNIVAQGDRFSADISGDMYFKDQ